MANHSEKTGRAAIAGAISGLVLLPIMPMTVQSANAGISLSAVNQLFLLELGASYLFLMMAGAPISGLVGAVAGAVAYVRLTRVSSHSRLLVEAAVLGILAGGLLAFVFAELGEGAPGIAPFVILPLSGVAFGLIVLLVIRRRLEKLPGS
jgi:hypothetical protein